MEMPESNQVSHENQYCMPPIVKRIPLLNANYVNKEAYTRSVLSANSTSAVSTTASFQKFPKIFKNRGFTNCLLSTNSTNVDEISH